MALDRFRESCGVVGASGVPDASAVVHRGLHALQHRGEAGAGIASWDGATLQCHRGAGRISSVFQGRTLDRLAGQHAIGHNHQAPPGAARLESTEPVVAKSQMGSIALASHGKVFNAAMLRAQLEARGSILQTTADTELILHLMAASRQGTVVNRLVDALYAVVGSYSMVLLHEGRLIAVRDPWGFHPLVLGRHEAGFVVSSESCAFPNMKARLVREVEPGEMVIIEDEEVISLRPLPRRPRAACVDELLYLSRPDSVTFGVSVYAQRKALGRQLAAEQPVAADVVIAVPTGGVPAALGFAEASGLPFEAGLLCSPPAVRGADPRDGGRNTTDGLAGVRSVLEGRRVVVVDHSLARGNTARAVVRLVQDCGASEVHLRVTAPPMLSVCFSGVDTTDQQKLPAARLTRTEIGSWLGVDSLGYLSVDGLRAAQEGDHTGYCDARFSGEFPIDPNLRSEATQVGLFERSS